MKLKSTDNQPKHIEESNDNDFLYPKKTSRPIGLIVSLVLATLLGIGGTVGGYLYGDNSGWIRGNVDGREAAYSEGYEKGKEDGYNSVPPGFSQLDLNNSYQRGYNVGFEEMRVKALCIMNGGGARC